MNEKIVKIINILEDKFFVPIRTDGENILMGREEIEAHVNIYWQKENNWESIDVIEALDYMQIPAFLNDSNIMVYIYKPKVSF
ncbi:hypothetical protein [Sphingobacterium paramultivorum]|jgi:hypothetical protein|uniref:hypothetical protein n=1 Tax=Sphingobacterium paramultivorum TaxID=2886510 RepID=UPI00129CD034|nr:hypothetical protein [Sphingobacterium paramultivorum]MDR2274503.1 hypothetical protein [Sphingobacterium sp.]